MQSRLRLMFAIYCMVFLRLESSESKVNQGRALTVKPLLKVTERSYDVFGNLQTIITNIISPDKDLTCTVREYDFPDFTNAKIAIDTANVFILSRTIFLDKFGANWLEKVTKKANLTGIADKQSKYQGEKPFVLVLPDVLNNFFSHLDKPHITESSLYIKAQKLVILHHELSKALLTYPNTFKFYSKRNTDEDKAFIVYEREMRQQTRGWSNQAINWFNKKNNWNTSKLPAATEAEWETFQSCASALFSAPKIESFKEIKKPTVTTLFKKNVTGNNLKISLMSEEEKKSKGLNETRNQMLTLGRAYFESQKKQTIPDNDVVIEAETVYVIQKNSEFDDPKNLGFDHTVKLMNEDLNSNERIVNYQNVILAIGQNEFANQTFVIKANTIFFQAAQGHEAGSFKDSMLENTTFKVMGTEGANNPQIFDLDTQKQGVLGWTPLIDKKDEWTETPIDYGRPQDRNLTAAQPRTSNVIIERDDLLDDSGEWRKEKMEYSTGPLVQTDPEQKRELSKTITPQSTPTPNPVPPSDKSGLIPNIWTSFLNMATKVTEVFANLFWKFLEGIKQTF